MFTTDDVKSAETDAMEDVDLLVLFVKLGQDFDQDLALFVHDLEEIVENLEMEGGRNHSASLEPLVPITTQTNSFFSFQLVRRSCCYLLTC